MTCLTHMKLRRKRPQEAWKLGEDVGIKLVYLYLRRTQCLSWFLRTCSNSLVAEWRNAQCNRKTYTGHLIQELERRSALQVSRL